MGHPWPIVPRLASMPNAPLHSTYARPPDGIRGPRCLGDLWTAKQNVKAEAKASRASPLLQGRRTFVGWVERSDTHQAGNQTTAWVSLYSTHPTTRWCELVGVLAQAGRAAGLPGMRWVEPGRPSVARGSGGRVAARVLKQCQNSRTRKRQDFTGGFGTAV